MGRYQFYCAKIEKDNKQTLNAFFYLKMRFYELLDWWGLGVDDLY